MTTTSRGSLRRVASTAVPTANVLHTATSALTTSINQEVYGPVGQEQGVHEPGLVPPAVDENVLPRLLCPVVPGPSPATRACVTAAHSISLPPKSQPLSPSPQSLSPAENSILEQPPQEDQDRLIPRDSVPRTSRPVRHCHSTDRNPLCRRTCQRHCGESPSVFGFCELKEVSEWGAYVVSTGLQRVWVSSIRSGTGVATLQYRRRCQQLAADAFLPRTRVRPTTRPVRRSCTD